MSQGQIFSAFTARIVDPLAFWSCPVARRCYWPTLVYAALFSAFVLEEMVSSAIGDISEWPVVGWYVDTLPYWFGGTLLLMLLMAFRDYRRGNVSAAAGQAGLCVYLIAVTPAVTVVLAVWMFLQCFH